MSPAEILPLGRDTDEPARRAARLLEGGGLVAYPTDTFYALGADPWNREAVERVYRLKGRPEEKPLPLLLPDAAWAERLWIPAPAASRLARRFWPGPLTVVAPAGPAAPPLPGPGTLALRVPGNPLTRSLLRIFGRPVTGTSANPAGAEPPRTAAEAAAFFPRGLDLVLDGGTYGGLSASTIVEVTGSGKVRILRPGTVPEGAIRKALRE